MPPIHNAAEFAHGWMLIGVTVNVLLLGVLIAQVYMYFTRYKTDKLYIKMLISVVLTADVLNTLFLFYYLYRSLIVHFNDSVYLMKSDWLFVTEPVLSGIISCLVQLFFAWRIYVMSTNWIYGVLVGCLAIVSGVSATVLSFQVRNLPFFADFDEFKITVVLWLGSGVVGDALITTMVVWYLVRFYYDSLAARAYHIELMDLQHTRKTGFRSSDRLIDRIIRIAIPTGLLTMIFACLDLGFYLTDPSGTHFMFSLPLCKLYSNSLMSSLNSRPVRLEEERSGTVTVGNWKKSLGSKDSEGEQTMVRSVSLLPTRNYDHTVVSEMTSTNNDTEVIIQVEKAERSL